MVWWGTGLSSHALYSHSFLYWVHGTWYLLLFPTLPTQSLHFRMQFFIGLSQPPNSLFLTAEFLLEVLDCLPCPCAVFSRICFCSFSSRKAISRSKSSVVEPWYCRRYSWRMASTGESPWGTRSLDDEEEEGKGTTRSGSGGISCSAISWLTSCPSNGMVRRLFALLLSAALLFADGISGAAGSASIAASWFWKFGTASLSALWRSWRAWRGFNESSKASEPVFASSSRSFLMRAQLNCAMRRSKYFINSGTISTLYLVFVQMLLPWRKELPVKKLSCKTFRVFFPIAFRSLFSTWNRCNKSTKLLLSMTTSPRCQRRHDSCKNVWRCVGFTLMRAASIAGTHSSRSRGERLGAWKSCLNDVCLCSYVSF